MPEKWKMKLAERTLPAIARNLGKIAEQFEKYNETDESVVESPSDGAVAELSTLRDEVTTRRAQTENKRLDAGDEDASSGEMNVPEWYHGQEDAYKTVTALIDAHLSEQVSEENQ